MSRPARSPGRVEQASCVGCVGWPRRARPPTAEAGARGSDERLPDLRCPHGCPGRGDRVGSHDQYRRPRWADRNPHVGRLRLVDVAQQFAVSAAALSRVHLNPGALSPVHAADCPPGSRRNATTGIAEDAAGVLGASAVQSRQRLSPPRRSRNVVARARRPVERVAHGGVAWCRSQGAATMTTWSGLPSRWVKPIGLVPAGPRDLIDLLLVDVIAGAFDLDEQLMMRGHRQRTA